MRASPGCTSAPVAHGAAVVARRDRVAAAKDLEGAERVEARRGALQPAAAPRDGALQQRAEPVARRVELGPLAREDGAADAANARRLSASPSRSRRRATRSRRATDEARQSVVERLLVRRDREARIAEPSQRPAERDAVLRDSVPAHGPREVSRVRRRSFAPRAPVGHHHLGRLRRRGGARVGGEVRERHVNLVTHRAHDRDAARGDGAHDGLLVEGAPDRRPTRRRARGR